MYGRNMYRKLGFLIQLNGGRVKKQSNIKTTNLFVGTVFNIDETFMISMILRNVLVIRGLCMLSIVRNYELFQQLHNAVPAACKLHTTALS